MGLFKGKFSLSHFRNLSILLVGAGVGQFLPLVVYPLLTKFYGIEAYDFGLYANYVAVSNILSVLGTLGFHMATAVADSEEESHDLLLLSVRLTMYISAALFLIGLLVLLYSWNEPEFLLVPLEFRVIALFTIPLTVMGINLFQAYYYYTNRKSDFWVLSISRSIRGLFFSIAAIVLTVMFADYRALILANTLAWFASAIFLMLKSSVRWTTKVSLRAYFRKYRSFPVYYIPGQFLNKVSTDITSILFSALYGPDKTGYFFQVVSYLGAPVSFVASNVADVFRPLLVKRMENKQSARPLFLRSTLLLAIASVIPFFVVYSLIDDFFLYFFGEQYALSIVYGRVMLIMLYFNFCLSPISGAVMHVTRKLAIDLFWQIGLVLGVLLAIFAGYYLKEDIYYSVVYYVAVFCLMYLLNWLLAYKFAVNTLKGNAETR